MLPALRSSATAELVAIASRDRERARVEAALFGAPKAYKGYQALLDDPEVEAVYIPLPNALHLEWASRAIEAGKHVLCEKPLACSAIEAEQMASLAAARGVVLMEAYMTAFHPRSQRALELARDGTIGEVRSVRSVFTFPNQDALNHRWRPEMGGGALLDVGVYCLEPILALGGEAVEVYGREELAPSAVDSTFEGGLELENDVTGTFLVSFDAPEAQLLEIVGTEGYLSFERAFTAGPDDREIEVVHRDRGNEVIDAGGNDPYLAMVEHFAAVVRGEAVSLRPPSTSIRTLAVIDRLRAAAANRR